MCRIWFAQVLFVAASFGSSTCLAMVPESLELAASVLRIYVYV